MAGNIRQWNQVPTQTNNEVNDMHILKSVMCIFVRVRVQSFGFYDGIGFGFGVMIG